MGLEEGLEPRRDGTSPGSAPGGVGRDLWHPRVALAGSFVPVPAAVAALAGPCGRCFEARHWLSSLGGIRPRLSPKHPPPPPQCL